MGFLWSSSKPVLSDPIGPFQLTFELVAWIVPCDHVSLLVERASLICVFQFSISSLTLTDREVSCNDCLGTALSRIPWGCDFDESERELLYLGSRFAVSRCFTVKLCFLLGYCCSALIL
ncbi:hypothetical protein KP509_29G040300 [Ceratopteris richardii]|uniref:Uncharacterized protein n=1 Tax=Ceratopteris richardii TaxID=49495 RepID=A0A8T2R7X3_CERRI|nr:hypothetical protein KP509_29G040300 [Ceratopteris richardii]